MKINYYDQRTETWRAIFVKDTDPRAKQVLAIFDEASIESNPPNLTGRLLKMLWRWLLGIFKASDKERR